MPHTKRLRPPIRHFISLFNILDLYRHLRILIYICLFCVVSMIHYHAVIPLFTFESRMSKIQLLLLATFASTKF